MDSKKLILTTLLACTLLHCNSVFTEFEENASSSASCSSTAEGAFQSGSGASSDPYIICTATQLAEISNNLSAHFKQGQNIDLGCSAFAPIGSNATPFSGSYDGAGYTINNLCISLPTTDYVGLFAAIDAATISRVKIANADVEGRSNTAILAGRAVNSSLTEITIQGDAKSNLEFLGMVAGLFDGTSLDLCNLQGDVDGQQKVGMIVGAARNSSSIKRCFASGNIVGFQVVGGLAGLLRTSSTLAASMLYNGSVNALENPGGLVGHSQDATIDSCLTHLTNMHRGAGLATLQFGGLVGKISGTATTTNINASYAIIDNITGVTSNEAIIGDLNGNTANVEYCYMQDTSGSGLITNANGGVNSGLKANLASSLQAATNTDYHDGADLLLQTSASGAFSDDWAYFSFANDGNYPQLGF